MGIIERLLRAELARLQKKKAQIDDLLCGDHVKKAYEYSLETLKLCVDLPPLESLELLNQRKLEGAILEKKSQQSLRSGKLFKKLEPIERDIYEIEELLREFEFRKAAKKAWEEQ